MKLSGVLLLEDLSLYFGDENCLVTRVLYWHFLESVRKICTFLVFFLVTWFLLVISLEEYKYLQPPPSFIDAGASPTHQASQRGSRGQLDKLAQILKTLWNCCANLK
jgi:hypothetical protein